MIRLLTYTILFILLSAAVYGQQQNPDQQWPYVEETIILQSDRDLYISGETLSFRADYLINNKKSDVEISKVLYVELISQKGESVSSNKFSIQDGFATGSLEITEGLLSGYYILRAYSQYQRNFRPEQYAQLPVMVINPAVPLPGWNEQDTIIDIAPEHGVLAHNIKSKVAVHIDHRLVGKINQASLVDQHLDTISFIKIFPNGLGLVEFTPLDSLKYSLLLTLSNKDSIFTGLPEVQKQMLKLEAEIDKGSLFVRLTQAMQNGGSEKDYKLSVYSQGYCLLAESEIEISNRWTEIKRAPKCLGPGIIYLVLENDQDEYIQVKTLLKPFSEKLDIAVKASKSIYAQREQAIVTLSEKSGNMYDSLVQVSIAVVKKGTFSRNDEYLPEFVVLNPDLLPVYLNTHNLKSEPINEQVDAAFILHDRHLNAEDIFANQLKKENDQSYWFPESRGITLRGVVREKTSGKAVPGMLVYTATIGDEPQLHLYTTDENGEFISTLNYVEDLNSVFLCLKSDHEEDYEILVKSDFSNVTPAFKNVPVMLDTAAARFIRELYVNAQVSQNFSNKREVKSEGDNRKPIRFADPMESIVVDDYIALPSLEVVFDELVPYVNARKRKGDYYLEVLDKKTNVLYGEPLILLDNIPIVDVNELMKIPPAKIERIDVINSTYIYGDHVLRGIVMLKTNTDNFAGIALPVSSTFLEFDAVSTSSCESQTDANSSFYKNPRIPDFRNILYWNPNVMLDKNEHSLTFYTSDDQTSYDIIVRGVTNDGRFISGNATLAVSGN